MSGISRISRIAAREPRLRAISCAALIAVLVGPALAQRTLEFRDIGAVRGVGIATRTSAGTPPVVREPPSRPNGRASPDPSLGAPVARLALDAAGFRAAAALPVGQVVAAGSPLVEFDFAGHVIAMAIVERVFDVDFDAAHYLLIAPGSRDYARFTVSRAGHEIVGTMILGDDEHRVLPEEDGYQLVFPVVMHSGAFRRDRGPSLATRSERLEARHLQMAWFAEHQPPGFRTEPDGRLVLYRADAGRRATLGRVDLTRAMQVDAAGKVTAVPERLAEAVASFLNDIRPRTLFDGPVQIAIERADLGGLYEGVDAVATVRFKRLIYDVPVDGEGGRVEIDRSGDVLQLTLDMTLPSRVKRSGEGPLTADGAESIARAAVLEKYAVDWPLQAQERTLSYFEDRNFTPVSPGLLVADPYLELRWKIVLGNSACELRFDVRLNASSGEVVDVSNYPPLATAEGPTAFLANTMELFREKCRGGQSP